MRRCSQCDQLLDQQAHASGRCGRCGALLPASSDRSGDLLDNTRTIELSQELSQADSPEGGSPGHKDPDHVGPAHADLDQAKSRPFDQESETLATVDLSLTEPTVCSTPLSLLDEQDDGTGTMQFAPDQTVELGDGSSTGDADEEQSLLLVSAAWEDSIDNAGSDPNVTIKQNETLVGDTSQRSSVVVKSRHVRTTAKGDSLIGSPVEAPDYELLNVIGEGGMGVVYAAKQSSIARTVAVKMLKGDDLGKADQRDKFISEAVVTGELEHPNIVPVYDLGSNDAGALFYSMKRVRGTPWNKVLKKKGVDENLSILLRVADAVAFAHANGVVHRDLKPENVMLGDFGEVLVMDWGLARISPDFPNAESVSQSEVMGGTPAYMAPEMATGPIDKISGASDVYLLGAMLFEIVAGRPPHAGKTVMACLLAASNNTIVDTPERGELIEIAFRAMATDPMARYATVQDFQDAIRQFQAHSESILMTDSAAQNLTKAVAQKDYDLYARALFGLQEAISLWDGNRRALQLLSQCRIAYAQYALNAGDLDLGVSLLDRSDPLHDETLARLDAARQERESRRRRFQLLKVVVALLLVAVVTTVATAYFAVRNQRNKARTQRDRAVVAEQEATDNYDAAEVARKNEKVEKERAIAAEKKATENFNEAEAARQIAETEKKRALEAKQAEEYEAYVARIGLAKAKIDENAFDRALELLDQCQMDLRHWEWGRLAYLCRLSSKQWLLDAPVESIAYAPDGRHLASGDWDGKLRLWDIESDACAQAISQGEYVHAVAFNSQGSRLATGSSDHTVRIYAVDYSAEEPLTLYKTLSGHTDAVLSVHFAPDGRSLVSSGYDNTARWWDLATGTCTQVLQGHSWWVWSARFSPNGRQIVTAGQDGKAIVWNLSSADTEGGRGGPRYEMKGEFAEHHGPIYVARYTPDGSHIATGGYDRRVLIWDPGEVKKVDIVKRLDGAPDPPAPYQELSAHTGPVRALAFSPNQGPSGAPVLASGGEDNRLLIWGPGGAGAPKSGHVMQTLRGHASAIRGCAWAPDGNKIASVGQDRQLKLWQPDLVAESIPLGGRLAVAHEDAVLDARFSADGRWIATASRDRTAALWDASSVERVMRFEEGHQFLTSKVRFFPDGTRLVTAAGDGSARIWDVATRTEIHLLQSTGRIGAVDVADDGRLVVTGGDGGQVQIWDARSGDRVAILQGHAAEVTAVRFAPGSHLLATGDARGIGRLWTRGPPTDAAKSGNWVAGKELRGHSKTITAMAFALNGDRLISASGDNTCGQWEVKTGTEITRAVLRHPDWVTDLEVSADGRRALTCSDDGKLRLWSVEDGQLLRTVDPGVDGLFTSVDLAPDGRVALVVCPANRTVHLWDLEADQHQTDTEEGRAEDGGQARAWLDLHGSSGMVWAARFSPDGKRVVTVGGNDARLWDRDTGAPEGRFSPHGAIASVDISPDGTLLVTGSWDRTAKIWDIHTGKAVIKLEGSHRGFVNSVRFSPDGKAILTASDDGSARLWDVATGQPKMPVFNLPGTRIHQAVFQADGNRILTVSGDRLGRIWDVQTGKLCYELAGHEWAVLCGQFSSDGHKIVTGSEDNRAILWDGSTGQQLHTLSGHTGSITAVAFSADGRRVLTGSEDNLIKLWDAETGKEILTLSGHLEAVTSVHFSPQGQSALSSGRDGRAILWPAAQWQE
jgi:WD40 repeat protein/serine/threonine protein kinase